MGENTKERLQRFYEFYNPTCLSSVDAILSTYSGREEDIFRVLVDKYGPEPTVSPLHRQSTGGDMNWFTRFHRFYEYYRPEKLNELPQKLKKHSGREAEWMALLKMKYGDEPPLWSESVKNEKQTKEMSTELSSQHPFSASRSSSENCVSNIDASTTKNIKEGKTSPPGDGVDDILKRLSVALDVKTSEVLVLKRRNENLEKELDRLERVNVNLQETDRSLRRQLLSVEERNAEERRILSEADRKKIAEEDERNAFHAQLLTSKRECGNIRLLFTRLEQRYRILEVEKQQALEELKDTEKRITEISDLLTIERKNNLALLNEIGQLKLQVERPGNESAFASLINDIEKRFADHHEAELKQYHKEMRDYYAYAESQLKRRDVLIADLTANCRNSSSEFLQET